MLMPAPTEAASPTKNALWLSRVRPAGCEQRRQGRYRSVHQAKQRWLDLLQNKRAIHAGVGFRFSRHLSIQFKPYAMAFDNG